MHAPRIALLLLFICTLITPILAQEPPPIAPGGVANGKELYKQGDFDGAIKVLRQAVRQNQDDAESWHHLGLALAAKGKKDDARKALEKAFALRDNFIWPKPPMRTSSKERPDLTYAQRKARRTEVAAALHGLIETLEKYIELKPKQSDLWRMRLESMRIYAALLSEESKILVSKDGSATPVTTRAVITYKPEPSFTEKARGSNVEGVVKLRLLLASDGTVRGIYVIKFLKDGLTENAIKAARQIKFTPATIDGQFVSQFITIEYNFSVY